MLTQRRPPSCGKVRVSDRAVLGETCLRSWSRGVAVVSDLDLTFQSLSLWGIDVIFSNGLKRVAGYYLFIIPLMYSSPG